MADLSDVEIGIVTLLTGTFFPGGGYQMGAMTASSAAGLSLSIYRGWPTDTQLYQDVLAGYAHISVFSEPGMTRNTSRYPSVARQGAFTASGITTAVSGTTVTLTGAPAAKDIVAISWGTAALEQFASYLVLANDTLATIAAALAALIPGATSSGAVVTVPSSLAFLAAVTAAPQQDWTEVSRQDQGFRISCWCPTPAARDAVAGLAFRSVISMADVNGNLTRFMTLATGERAWLRHRTDYVNDMVSRDKVWRRDICVTAEYPTSIIQSDPVVLFAAIAANNGQQIIQAGQIPVGYTLS